MTSSKCSPRNGPGRLRLTVSTYQTLGTRLQQILLGPASDDEIRDWCRFCPLLKEFHLRQDRFHRSGDGVIGVKSQLILTQLVMVTVACAALCAQDEGPRSVVGVVTDPSNKPVDGAVVQLKNRQTLEFRSYITQHGGKYCFFRLSPNFDYELRATHNGVWSNKEQLSVFSSKKELTINLKLKSP